MRVGICLPISERPPERRAHSYAQMREMAVLAEESGLDSIWVADHLFIARGEGQRFGAWESWTILSALAEATQRVEIGPLVLCTPFRNPGVIASMANALDEVSGGRLVLGLGSGWHQPEFDAYGFEFEHRVSVFADSLAIIVPLLREGRVDYQGRMLSAEAELRPPPTVRPGGPPILIAGSRPRMMSLTARWADRWNSVWYGLPTDEFRRERADLEQACLEIGRPPSEIEVTVGIAVRDRAAMPVNGTDALAGTVDQIAEGLSAWRDEGVAEVMCRLEPPSLGVIESIAGAAAQLRGTPLPA